MSKYYIGNAKCPLYKSESGGSIRCESNISAAVQHNFSDRASCKAHKKKYCRRDFEECAYYKAYGAGKGDIV